MTRFLWVAMFLLLASACDEDAAHDCSESVQRPLLGGDVRWPLGDATPGAVVRIDILDRGGVVDVCSGTFIAGSWVLTARHCITSRPAGALRIVTGAGAHLPRCAPSPGQPVLEIRAHPELDLALLRVAFTHPQALAVGALTNDEHTFVAGHGIDESGAPGLLRFAPVLVDEADGRFAWVRAASAGGACFGDSGGPLLVQRAGGTAVVGVLNIGSADCLGRDRYALLDPADPWLPMR